MNLSVGIVGLPNVGKSTLFNALLKKQIAFVANYPFATIEPNIGVVPVPDERLKRLAEIIREDIKILRYKDIKKKTEKSPSISISQYPNIPPIVPATVKFVDIAGLVKGANEGAGLGNKFLFHIRETSIIAHVVRAFEDPNIIKEGSVDPKSDYSTIQTELILSDLESLAKSKVNNDKKPSILSSIDSKRQEVIEKIYDSLNRGIAVRDIDFLEEEKELIKNLFLLSAKPEIVVLNVSENDYTENKFQEIYSRYTSISSVDKMVVLCAKIESDLSELSEQEQKEYLNQLGLKESGLERLIRKAYEMLGLISFLTAPASAEASARQWGKWEVRAWTIRSGSTALAASGTIHTDFEKKFIKAEVVSYNDFVSLGGWKNARERGKARMEGRDYVVKDGDVIEFKIGS